MTIKPHYVVPRGSEVYDAGRVLRVVGYWEDGLSLVDEQTGDTERWTYDAFDARRKSASFSLIAPQSGRQGRSNECMRYRYVEELPQKLQEQADFRQALCRGVESLVASGIKPTEGQLNKAENRKKIRLVASAYFEPLRKTTRGGGKSTQWGMPRGRSLKKYWQKWNDSGRDPLSLPDADWRKGNTEARVPHRVRLLMDQASEIYLDRKRSTYALAHRELAVLVRNENRKYQIESAELLQVPSATTLAKHINERTLKNGIATARDGEKLTNNRRASGATDIRALMVGERIEIDEVKLSVITPIKRAGRWQALSNTHKEKLEEIEEEVRKRLILVVAIDVASRMPLGWVLTENVGAEATIELFRMITRDKTREKVIYGCKSDPMPAVGVNNIVGDNGSGLRNAVTKAAGSGISRNMIDGRAYASGDKPYVEAVIGTSESQLIQWLPGYTGRDPNHLTDYDSMKNGIIDPQQLYALISRYFIDVYPNQKHHGVGMFGRTPKSVAEFQNEHYGCLPAPDPITRRIHLGHKIEAKPSAQGVKAYDLPYQAIWTTDDAAADGVAGDGLIDLREFTSEKVSIYIDPDHLRYATIIVPGQAGPFVAELTITAFRDLSLAEYLGVLEEYCRMHPDAEQLAAETMLSAISDMRKQIHEAVREKGTPRSFMTIEEANAKARAFTAGRNFGDRGSIPGCVPPGSICGDLPDVEEAVAGDEPSAQVNGGHYDEHRDDTPDNETFSRPNTKGKLT
ncbi:transposase family protein [Roseivivax sediminis]|uniref:Transposase n=1 Tax=Roseivivax sediminis TaxID=936889 RepID=A0A1I2EHT0_9RHOB|nr:transposase family protein [Roseivivax sediminis]SFE92644.1 hypothetical protein SAMN04515678_12413 [Roseivivax sediminis]